MPIGDAAFVVGYPSYSDIEQRMFELNTSYPDICALHQLGITYEGRTIWAMEISDNVSADEEEPEVLIMGEHHANELISAIIPLMFAESILENYSTDRDVRSLVDSTDIWIVPVVNPDGYQYAWEGHTDWRKNRRPVDADGDGEIDGIGVDLNRNYGYRWCEDIDGEYTSDDPQSRVYCGPAPFSENETRAIRNLALSHDFVFSVSFHSYGQVIYHPWGNKLDSSPMDEDLMDAIGAQMSGYNLYRVMEGNEAYPTTGDSDDWLYSETSCLPFTVELGTSFIPPPSEIDGIFLRNSGALLYLLSIAKNPYLALSDEKTNLRIENFTVSDGTASVYVENQGNYSVSALLTVSSPDGLNRTSLLLGPGESRMVSMKVGDGTDFQAIISPMRHAEEWNSTDNVAEYHISEEPGDSIPYGFVLPLVALGVVAALIVLFKKHKLH